MADGTTWEEAGPGPDVDGGADWTGHDDRNDWNDRADRGGRDGRDRRGRGGDGPSYDRGDGSYRRGDSARTVRDALFDRVPPHDDDAEMAVLGGMLMSKDAIGEVSQTIDVADFYQPKHQTKIGRAHV